MRILITGGTGFIGSRLVTRLAGDHDVHCLVRHQPAEGVGGVRFCIQDLSAQLRPDELPERVDAVIHLAQSKHYKDFPDKADDIYRINVASTFNLLEYARGAGAKQFLYASTGGVYGTSYDRFVETDKVDPINFYLSTKCSAELLIANYKTFFNTVVVRPFFPYGKGQSRAMLVPRLVHSVLAGEPILLRGEQGLHINPLYVEDAADALVQALTLDDSYLINLAGPRVLSLAEIGRTIGDLLGVEPVFDVAECEGGASHLVGDITTMERLLGAPRVDFAEGAVEVCEEAKGQLDAPLSRRHA